MRVWFFLAYCLSAGLFAGCHAPVPSVAPPTLAETVAPKSAPAPPPDRSPFAGEFYFGDGEGTNCALKLSKEGKVSFQWHGCLGLYDQNNGTFTREGDQIVLHLTGSNKRKPGQGTPIRFYPVKWGPRLYLVADEQMLGFCSRVARGWIPDKEMHGFHYLRRGDNKKPVRESPAVPALFRPVLKKPFAATITGMRKGGPIIIDRGSRQGIVPRTRFSLETDEWTWLQAIRVSDDTTECEMWDTVNQKGHPKIGMRVYPVPY